MIHCATPGTEKKKEKDIYDDAAYSIQEIKMRYFRRLTNHEHRLSILFSVCEPHRQWKSISAHTLKLKIKCLKIGHLL